MSNDFEDASRVAYVDDWQRAAEYLAAYAQPGDVMVTMSCGTVYQIIPQVVTARRDRFEPAGQ